MVEDAPKAGYRQLINRDVNTNRHSLEFNRPCQRLDTAPGFCDGFEVFGD